MNRFLFLWPLLVASTAGGAQVPGGAATQVVVPAPAQPPARAVDVVSVPQSEAAPAQSETVPSDTPGPAASVIASPMAEPKASFVGELPPVALTLVYPPGQGDEFILETHNLMKGDDGYYSPTSDANSFVLKIPEPSKGMPVSITCSVRGQPRAVGSLYWLYSNGAPGGGVDFRFPAGESDTRYETNFAGQSAYPFPMKSMWLTLPPATAIKECRVSGTFERSSQ